MPKIPTKGAEEARSQLPNLLDAAERGKTTIVTRRGRPVAAIIPAADVAIRGAQRGFMKLRGAGKGAWGPDPRAAIAVLRSEWDR